MKKRVLSRFKSLIAWFVTMQLRFFTWFTRRYRWTIPPEKKLLKQFLMTDIRVRQQMLAHLSMPLFEGLHPKNVFFFRGIGLSKYLSPQDIVIDVGCGTGRMLSAFAASIRKGYGIDSNPENLKLCQTLHARPNLEYIAADLFHYDWKQFKQTSGYNTALLSHVLEHLPDPVALLNTLNAEKLLVCVPSEENWIAQLRKSLKLPYLSDGSHVKDYSHRQLAAELTAAGYAIRAMYYNAEGEIECCATKPTVSLATQPRVCYAGMAPHNFEIAGGGRVKLMYLQQAFPEYFDDFDILYVVSSALPANLSEWIDLCKAQRKKIVLNQNGVGYPGWAGEHFEQVNQPLRQALHAADYVLYQSEFAKRAADRFLGVTDRPSEILYNAVDTEQFTPNETSPHLRVPILLLSGSQMQTYRVEAALRTVNELKNTFPAIQLIVTGLSKQHGKRREIEIFAKQLAHSLAIQDHILFADAYAHHNAANLYRQATILLHPQYNDVCPGVVLEAMACGLPVVYSNSGGTPELVGEEAGIGIDAEQSWERDCPPAPEELADAVRRVLKNYDAYASAARTRAVNLFDSNKWLARHRVLFKSLSVEIT